MQTSQTVVIVTLLTVKKYQCHVITNLNFTKMNREKKSSWRPYLKDQPKKNTPLPRPCLQQAEINFPLDLEKATDFDLTPDEIKRYYPITEDYSL